MREAKKSGDLGEGEGRGARGGELHTEGSPAHRATDTVEVGPIVGSGVELSAGTSYSVDEQTMRRWQRAVGRIDRQRVDGQFVFAVDTARCADGEHRHRGALP